MGSILVSKFGGIALRHGATALGGYLIASGYADEATVQQIVGGAVALGGVVLSLAEKSFRW
tara:strand:+ start:571 stop:753 length:183 start_codon:yes stop_codon:yes gene_type:complete